MNKLRIVSKAADLLSFLGSSSLITKLKLRTVNISGKIIGAVFGSAISLKCFAPISAEAKLNMLFLNMDFFNSMFAGEGVSVEEQLSKGATIKYSNFYGY